MSKRTFLLSSVLAGGTVIILVIGTVFSFMVAKNRTGTIVLPGGITYLGPTPSPPPTPGITDVRSGRFKPAADVAWETHAGTRYPYRVSLPATLPTTTFPNDPSDAVGISWNGNLPQDTILISVEDLSKNVPMKRYMTQPKEAYVKNWWKQFSGLTGFASVTEFTNTGGLHGYKAKYINTSGQTPNDDIFFEVPGHQELVIRVANGVIDPAIFERIVDSVTWDIRSTEK